MSLLLKTRVPEAVQHWPMFLPAAGGAHPSLNPSLESVYSACRMGVGQFFRAGLGPETRENSIPGTADRHHVAAGTDGPAPGSFMGKVAPLEELA